MKTNKTIALSLITICSLLFLPNETKAQQEIPDNIKDHISQGISAFESAKTPADIDKALLEFNEAAKIAPDNPDVHYYLAKTYSLLQGNAGRAVNEFKKYLKLYPDAPEKAEITKDIDMLNKVIETSRLSTVLGVELVSLHDGIYIRKINLNSYNANPTASRLGSRDQTFIVKEGDKLLKVNDTDISGLPLADVLRLFDKYPEKSLVPVMVVRGGTAHPSHFGRSIKTKINNVSDLGEEDLSAIVAEAKVPVIVFFWNPVDAECKKYLPDIMREANTCKEAIKMITVSVNENATISSEFNVSEIPAILYFKEGKLFGKINKYQPELFKEKTESINSIKEPFGL
jgi:thioredoxin 1